VGPEPQSHCQPQTSPVPPCSPASVRPALLALDREAAELLLGFERDLEPRLAAGSGDLAHLAGWAAKLAGAIRLAGYLIEHARAVFDLMGADPRTDDARWLLDWITRPTAASSAAAMPTGPPPRGRFATTTDLEPALRLLEEHGYLRRVDPEPSQDPRGRGRPASPRFLVNPLPRAAEMTETPKAILGVVLSILAFLRRAAMANDTAPGLQDWVDQPGQPWPR
jgi:replicative DNA helicase